MEKIGGNDPCTCGSGKKLKHCCSRDGLAPVAAAPSRELTLQALFQSAVGHHQSGRLDDADALYRQILRTFPGHADALHLSGVIALQRGQHDVAVERIRQALRIRPSEHYFANLGNALKAQGHLAEAISCYRQALAIAPTLAEAHCNLGNALTLLGEFDEAIACCNQAIALKPNLAEAHTNLGNALRAQGRLEDAVACYRRTLQIHPDLAETHSNLGSVLKELGKLDDAIDSCRRALRIKPDFAEAHSHLGHALLEKGQSADAIASYERALLIRPGSADVHRHLARAFRQHGRLDLAIGSYLDALDIDDNPANRAGFVQCIRDAHFNAAQPDIRAYVIRALAETWARPGDLLTPALSLVALNPGIRDSSARARQAWPARLSRGALFGDTGFALVADDGLLLCLLDNVAINSIDLERLLTMTRALMLDDALAIDEAASGAAWDRAAPFYCAIARQCFINEYVYDCTDRESAQLRLLQETLEARLAAGSALHPLAIVALAAYVPLSTLAGKDMLADRAWPDAVHALFTQQLREPAIEQGYRASMPRLTAIDDGVSRLVQEQYEANPYPRWIRLPQAAKASSVDALMRHQFPGAPFHPLGNGGTVEILIAGCGTGQHPIETARQFTGASVLAIDLSLASLCYAKRKTEELGLDNIRYAQADIMNLGSLGQTFDLIESSGVLHHLADPVAGWTILRDLLRPGGLMCVGLYSEIARADIVAARAHIAREGYAATAAGIRRCRQDLMADEHAGRYRHFLASRDFYAMSDCRDLLFHVQEHRFSVLQLKEIVHALGLELLGFMVDADAAARYSSQFPDDPARTSFDHWHAFETAHPQTFSRMYQFWVQKPKPVP